MNILGQILMWAGFLSGSLATVFNIEVADDKWSTIDWTWYGASLAVGVFGIVLLRIGKKSTAEKSEKSSANLKSIKGNLADIVVNVQNFNKEIRSMKPRQMIEYIESSLTDNFREFADGRESITAELGLDVFAQVMTNFAAGERYVNRAWCAAADGYVDEAANSIQLAEGFLKQAKADLDEVSK